MLFFYFVVAEDNHGLQFNGSNVSMTQEVTKTHFSGLDWEYGRPQNGPEYLMANGRCNEDITVAVSKNYNPYPPARKRNSVLLICTLSYVP